MNDERNESDTDVVGELIRRAGRRENPSDDDYARVFAAASAARLDGVIRRSFRTWIPRYYFLRLAFLFGSVFSGGGLSVSSLVDVSTGPANAS